MPGIVAPSCGPAARAAARLLLLALALVLPPAAGAPTVVLPALLLSAALVAALCREIGISAERRDFLSLIEDGPGDFLWATDRELRFRGVSRRFSAVLGETAPVGGLSLPEWISVQADESPTASPTGTRLLEAFAVRSPFRDLQVVVTVAGARRVVSFSGRPVATAWGRFDGYRGIGSEISAAVPVRSDGLTGLGDRAAFREALGAACPAEASVCLLVLDLDGFRTVNETFGQAAGDAVLAASADRIRGLIGSNGAAFRIGADEFAVIVRNRERRASEDLAETLVHRVSEPFVLDGGTARLGVSVGLAFPAETGADPDELFRGADLALSEARAKGRGTPVVFGPALAAAAGRRRALRSDLQRAIEGDELELDFQPVVDLESGEVTSAEALVRWSHPDRGRIAPADFIPLAEEAGLIVPLGAWVLRRACREAMSWAGDARVAVNLSPLQFRDPGLLATIEAVLAETGLPARRLELEITETVFLDAAEPTLRCLHALRALGIQIALDDFGTGYSALQYLRRFPFDKVKIDRSFVHDLGLSDNTTAIVRAIVGLASSLGMCTTGEGVETTSQVEFLQTSGCSHVQGYLFGRPCAPEIIARIMRSNRGPVVDEPLQPRESEPA